MSIVRTSALALVVPALAALVSACATAHAAPTEPTSASIDVALSRDKATAAVASIPEFGTDCRVIAIVADPIAAQHLEDPNAQQTAGRSSMVVYGPGAHDDKVVDGTVLATIIGKTPSGEMLGNHHVLTAQGTLRTQNDVIAITPTADKCVVNAKAKVFVHDGSGQFAGYSGTAAAAATLNFCGGAGHAVLYGRICKAGGK